jgi:hypothetical protein
MGHFGTQKCENPLDKAIEGEKKKRGFDTFLYCQSMVADKFGAIPRARLEYDVNETI